MVLVPELLIEKLIVPAGALVALTSQAVSAALTLIGPGSPGATCWGAVLVHPASATAVTAAPITAADLRDMWSSYLVFAGTGVLVRWGRRNSVSTTAT